MDRSNRRQGWNFPSVSIFLSRCRETFTRNAHLRLTRNPETMSKLHKASLPSPLPMSNDTIEQEPEVSSYYDPRMKQRNKTWAPPVFTLRDWFLLHITRLPS